MRVDDAGGCSPSVYGPQSDFEGMSHRQLLKLLDGASHSPVGSVAKKLTDAGDSLQEIARTLKKHMSDLDWQSAAGDSFRDWGHKVASATYTLSDYASSAGNQLNMAGDSLGSTQSGMPPVPEGAATTVATYRAHKGINGPFVDASVGTHVPAGVTTPTDTQYQQALGTLNTAHLEAADQMSSLGSAYSSASHGMSTLKEPVFPALPTEAMPPEPDSTRGTSSYIDPSSGGGAVGTPVTATTVGAQTTPGGIKEIIPGHTQIVMPHTHLDSNGNQDTTGGIAVIEPPSTLRPPRPSQPTSPFLPPPMPLSGLPVGPKNTGRYPGAGSGGEQVHTFGVTGPGRSAVRSSFGEGIEGGRLTEPGAGGLGGARARFSTGAVIGEESAAGGRPAGSGALPAEAAEGELYGGRAGAGSVGEAGQEGMASSRGMSGIGGMSSRGSRSQRGRRNGGRPDYLVEDEETWLSAGSRAVPSVFE